MRELLFRALAAGAIVATLGSPSAFAAQKHSKVAYPIGVGLASLNLAGSQSTALSAWLQLTRPVSFEALFAIVGTSPAVSFGLGGIVRANLAGDEVNGFHVGGQLLLGSAVVGPHSSSKFLFQFGPEAGLHFSIPNLERVRFSVDGGAGFQAYGGNLSFVTQALSAALGLSIHYMF